jgi:hypothetical protein
MLNGIFTIGRQTRVWLSLSLLALAGVLGGTRAEEGREMIYIEFRPVSPNIKPGSFEASVRKLWRSGDRYLRIEEALDPQRRIHGVIIVNEPDSWMWNRSDNTALHIVDRGPTFIAHYPIFQGENSLQALEFGKEKEFFAAHSSTPLPDQTIDDTEYAVQSLRHDDSTLMLYLQKSNGNPFAVAISNSRRAYSIRFEKYDAHVQFDSSLFTPPAGANVTEAK